MASMMGKKILYFIRGTSPTEKELSEAHLLGTKMFRNSQYGAAEAPEKCDAVAGDVPEAYSKFPRATLPEAPKANPQPVEGQPATPNPWKKE